MVVSSGLRHRVSYWSFGAKLKGLGYVPWFYPNAPAPLLHGLVCGCPACPGGGSTLRLLVWRKPQGAGRFAVVFVAKCPSCGAWGRLVKLPASFCPPTWAPSVALDPAPPDPLVRAVKSGPLGARQFA